MPDVRQLIRDWDDAVWCLAAVSLADAELDAATRTAVEQVLAHLGVRGADGRIADPAGRPDDVSGHAASSILHVADLLRGAGSWATSSPEALLAAGRQSAPFGAVLRTSLLDQMPGLGARLSAPGARLLDVGVGTGWLSAGCLAAFPALSSVGVDVLPRALELAAAHGLDRLELRLQDVLDLDEDSVYDLAWVSAPFLPRDALLGGLPRVARALRPGGWVLVGHRRLGGAALGDSLQRLRVATYGGTSLTDEDAIALLQDAGLDQVRSLSLPASAPAITAGRRPV